MVDVEIYIGQLRQQYERHRNAHDDATAATGIAHERGQPAAQAVRPGGDHEDHAERERNHQQPRNAARDRESHGQPDHRRPERAAAGSGSYFDEPALIMRRCNRAGIQLVVIRMARVIETVGFAVLLLCRRFQIVDPRESIRFNDIRVSG